MILVYGATGWMGGQVTKALLGAGIEVVLGGRDEHRLATMARRLGDEVAVRPAQIHDPADLLASMRGARVVVNCSGPYLQVGEPIVAAAIQAGAHYIDICAEQRFLRQTYEQSESQARHAGVTVLCGLGFEVALGDWAAALAARDLGCAGIGETADDGGAAEDSIDGGIDGGEECSEIAIAYAMDHFRPSPGAQKSVLLQLEAPGDVWMEDRWEPLLPTGEVRTFSFPEPFGARETVSFPSGEVVTVPRHISARRVVTYLALAGDLPFARLVTRAAAALAPALPALLRSPLGAFARAQATAGSAPPSEPERAYSRFALVAEARRGTSSARVAVTGGDLYALTAELCARAAAELYGGVGPAGVLAPSERFDAAIWLTDLARAGLIKVYRS